MSSDPLELIEIVEAAIAHRLTYAFPAGIVIGEVTTGPVNIGSEDWSRSLRTAAAHHLGRRVNAIPSETRDDASRLLFGLSLDEMRSDKAQTALAEAGLILAKPLPEGRLALARSVLTDDDGPVWLANKLELSPEATKEIGESLRLSERRSEYAERGIQVRSAGAPLSVAAFEAIEGSVRPDESPLAPLQTAAVGHVEESLQPSATELSELALALERQGNTVRARQLHEQSIAREPTNAVALGRFAAFLSRQTAPNSAHIRELYERALKSTEDARTLRNFAGFLWQEGELDAAEAHFKRALATAPNDANYLGVYGNFLQSERQDTTGAEALYQRALRANPNDPLVLRAYGFLLQERGELERAEALYRQALAVAPHASNVLDSYATLLMARGDYDGAEKRFEQALQADPAAIVPRINYALFQTSCRRDLDLAQMHYERALAIEPHSRVVLGAYAAFLGTRRHDYRRAEALFEQAIALSPVDANTLANFAHVLFLSEKTAKGVEVLQEALTHEAELKNSPAAAIELAFYQAAHVPEERTQALKNLHALIASGARSKDWNFTAHAALAKSRNDPDSDLLAVLGDVLADAAPAEALDAFPRWTEVSGTP
jgi:Tfp pilus assembly protein PilF